MRAALGLGIAACMVPAWFTPALARDVSVATDNARGSCHVTGAFSVPVRDSIAWVVLTDYDHIGRFVDSVKASKITSRESGHVMLRQEAVGGFLFLRRRVHVLLDIREVPTRRITFRDVLGRDFESYAGEWRVTSEPGGTHVDYQLAAEPRAAIPKSVCRGMLRHMAQGLLEQVRAEMIRRAQ